MTLSSMLLNIKKNWDAQLSSALSGLNETQIPLFNLQKEYSYPTPSVSV